MRLGTRDLESLRALATGCHAVPGRVVVVPAPSALLARRMFDALSPHLTEYGARPDHKALAASFSNGSVIKVRVGG